MDDFTAAEVRKVNPQGVVRFGDVGFHLVLDHTVASCGTVTAPVKVEPVVPVSRTV